jgi:hypothetical protein
MEPNEKRKEKRYPTNDRVRVFLMPSREEQVATILNVSKSGVQLELATPLPPQAKIEILASDGVATFGEVRYCHAAGPVYHAGIYIHDAIFMPRPEHIHEDSLWLYAKGRGLTAHEVLRIEAHLEHCDHCCSALAELSALQLDRLRTEKGLLREAISSLEKLAKFKRQI